MEDAPPTRLDTWLWVARILKTRALAADAVKGGRVRVGGEPAKPSRQVRPGDRLEITLGPTRLELIVRGSAPRRGPAKEAALLYEETDAGREARELFAAQRRLAAAPVPIDGPRPTKRDRRRLDATRGSRRRG